METIKDLHLLFGGAFALTYIIKAILLLTNNPSLADYRRKTMMPEMLIATLFILTGVYMLIQNGGEWLKVNGWFHIKLTLVLLAIPMGFIGYKRNNKAMAIGSSVIFAYVFWLAWTHKVTLFF